jgi:hypothetical protein
MVFHRTRLASSGAETSLALGCPASDLRHPRRDPRVSSLDLRLNATTRRCWRGNVDPKVKITVGLKVCCAVWGRRRLERTTRLFRRDDFDLRFCLHAGGRTFDLKDISRNLKGRMQSSISFSEERNDGVEETDCYQQQEKEERAKSNPTCCDVKKRLSALCRSKEGNVTICILLHQNNATDIFSCI